MGVMSRPILYSYFKVLSFKCEKGFAKNIFKKIPQPILNGENDFQLELLSKRLSNGTTGIYALHQQP